MNVSWLDVVCQGVDCHMYLYTSPRPSKHVEFIWQTVTVQCQTMLGLDWLSVLFASFLRATAVPSGTAESVY